MRSLLSLTLAAGLVVAFAACDAAGPEAATALAADASDNAAVVFNPSELDCFLRKTISTGIIEGEGRQTRVQTSSGQELTSCHGALTSGEAPDKAERVEDPFGFGGVLTVTPSGRFNLTAQETPFL